MATTDNTIIDLQNRLEKAFRAGNINEVSNLNSLITELRGRFLNLTASNRYRRIVQSPETASEADRSYAQQINESLGSLSRMQQQTRFAADMANKKPGRRIGTPEYIVEGRRLPSAGELEAEEEKQMMAGSGMVSVADPDPVRPEFMKKGRRLPSAGELEEREEKEAAERMMAGSGIVPPEPNLGESKVFPDEPGGDLRESKVDVDDSDELGESEVDPDEKPKSMAEARSEAAKNALAPKSPSPDLRESPVDDDDQYGESEQDMSEDKPDLRKSPTTPDKPEENLGESMQEGAGDVRQSIVSPDETGMAVDSVAMSTPEARKDAVARAMAPKRIPVPEGAVRTIEGDGGWAYAVMPNKDIKIIGAPAGHRPGMLLEAGSDRFWKPIAEKFGIDDGDGREALTEYVPISETNDAAKEQQKKQRQERRQRERKKPLDIGHIPDKVGI
tara:strand:+ start:6114 stop:7448 length:1335 start_codon:yes stop_codon:yes gene_type:complete